MNNVYNKAFRVADKIMLKMDLDDAIKYSDSYSMAQREEYERHTSEDDCTMDVDGYCQGCNKIYDLMELGWEVNKELLRRKGVIDTNWGTVSKESYA